MQNKTKHIFMGHTDISVGVAMCLSAELDVFFLLVVTLLLVCNLSG